MCLNDLFKMFKRLASLHKTKCDRNCSPLIWVWLFELIQQLKMINKLPSFISVEDIEREVRVMQQIFECSKIRVCTCHGDLKPSNMMVSDENELFFIDLDLGGPNYCAFDIMKLFRTSKEITSVKKEEHLKAFLEIYCKVLACNISPKAIYSEAKMCEPLTWLEAALFFSLSAALDESKTGEEVDHHGLFNNRWENYLETKWMATHFRL